MSSVKSDIKQVIYGVIAITSILIVIAIFFFGCSGDSTPIKSALSLMGDYVGAIATLAAAYIASLLFNDWREQHNKNIQKDYIVNIINSFDKADFKLAKFHEAFMFFKLEFDQLNNLTDDRFNNLDKSLQEVVCYLKGVNLDFSSYEDNIRKYSLLFNTNDREQIKQPLKKISESIHAIQIHEIKLPRSLQDINQLSSLIKQEIEVLERDVNDKLLRKIKAQ